MKHRLTTLLVLFTIAVTSAMAKDERGLYIPLDEPQGKHLYDLARAHRNDHLCLELSSQLYAHEAKRGDKYGMCRALCLPVQYWQLRGNEQEFLKAVNQLRNASQTSGCTALYYYSYFEEIDFYINTNRSLRAMHIINDLSKKLQKEPSAYGSYMVDVALGNIYFARRDEQHAKKYYLSAVKKSEQLHNNNDLPPVYLNLARITEARDVANREHYLRLALENSINPTDSAASLMGLAHMYSYVRENNKFMEMYKLYSPMLSRENISQVKFEKWYKANEAYRLVLEGRQDSAIAVRQSIQNPYYRFQAQSDFYMSHGDIEKANLYLDSMVMYMRSSQAEQNVSDVAEMAAIYETEQLRSEANRIRQGYSRDILAVALIGLSVLVLHMAVWMVRRRRDMKKMQQLSEDLRVARDEAVQASKMKDVFIQNMSHEIRTPLNAVAGFAQLMTLPDDCFEPGEKEQFIEHINNNTNLLTMLIDDILNISDVESGNYHIEVANYSVNEICRTAMATIQNRVTEDVDMTFTTEVDDSYMVDTDARRVQQVLINFLTNSIKHTREGHINLNVSLIETPGMVTFAVADTGTGVPEEKAETIFQRFEKLNAFVQGTGLGLNICRIIAEKLHGECSLDTTYPKAYHGVDHGARFIFRIPVEYTA